MRYLSMLSVLCLGAFGGAALADTTVPHVFTSGTPAKASDVNEDFGALATAIDNLSTRVDKLEGAPVTEAEILGTYRISILQIDVAWTNGPSDIDAIAYEGTITLAADHTFSANFVGHKNDQFGPHPDNSADGGTWSLANNEVTLNSAGGATLGTAHCALGCRLMFTTFYGGAAAVNDEGHNNIVILVRVT